MNSSMGIIKAIAAIVEDKELKDWTAEELRKVAQLVNYTDEEFETESYYIDSSVKDLETGMLVHSTENKGNVIKIPRHIIDIERFNKTLIDAWGNVNYPE